MINLDDICILFLAVCNRSLVLCLQWLIIDDRCSYLELSAINFAYFCQMALLVASIRPFLSTTSALHFYAVHEYSTDS